MIAYRPATVADLPALLALTPLLGRFDVPLWRTPEEIGRADNAILEEAVRSGDAEALVCVADEGGRVLGQVFVSTRRDYFTGAPHGHIEVLTVHPDAQGRGIGRELVARAEAWSRARGHGAMTLNVFARNEAARAVYDRLGYAPETIHYWKALS